MKVAIYVRVSTKKQDETNQLPRLREMAKNRGFEVYREYSDEASAKDANRPGWQDLITLSSFVTRIASNICFEASSMRSFHPGRFASFAEASSEYSR